MKPELNDINEDNYIKKERKKNKESNRYLKNCISTYIKRYKALIIVSCIVVLLSLLCVFIITANSSYIMVALRFSEMTQGNNPDGSPFNVYEIISDEVMQNACEKLDDKFTPDELRQHISLSSNSVSGSFNSIQEKVLDGNDNYYYFPNRYMITYSTVNDKIASGGILSVLNAFFSGFTKPPKEDILNAVAQAYSDEYENLHIIKDEFFEYDKTKITGLDHFNRVSELKRIAEKLSRYVNERYNEYIKSGSESEESFGTLSVEINNIINTDIDNYNSYVINNGITSDKDKLIKQLQYVVNDNNKIYEKKIAEYNVMMEAIELYDPNITRVTFIPSLDEANEFYMNRTKIGVDYLTRNANAAKIDADEAQNTAQHYEYLKSQFSNAPVTDTDALSAADNMSENIMKKLDDFCERAKAVNSNHIDNVTYEKIIYTGVESGKGLVYNAILILKIWFISAAALYVLYCLRKFLIFFLKREEITPEKVEDTGDNTKLI